MGGSSRTNTSSSSSSSLPSASCCLLGWPWWEWFHRPYQLNRHTVYLHVSSKPIKRQGVRQPTCWIPSPKCSLGTVKAVICIPQFPSAEQSWSMLSTPLPSSPAVSPAICRLTLPLSHRSVLHLCTSWKAIRNRAPWQWLQVLLPDYCIAQGRCACIFICMSVCMHAADTHVLSLTGTLQIQFGRASAPWYCKKILIIKYRLSSLVQLHCSLTGTKWTFSWIQMEGERRSAHARSCRGVSTHPVSTATLA